MKAIDITVTVAVAITPMPNPADGYRVDVTRHGYNVAQRWHIPTMKIAIDIAAEFTANETPPGRTVMTIDKMVATLIKYYKNESGRDGRVNAVSAIVFNGCPPYTGVPPVNQHQHDIIAAFHYMRDTYAGQSTPDVPGLIKLFNVKNIRPWWIIPTIPTYGVPSQS